MWLCCCRAVTSERDQWQNLDGTTNITYGQLAALFTSTGIEDYSFAVNYGNGLPSRRMAMAVERAAQYT